MADKPQVGLMRLGSLFSQRFKLPKPPDLNANMYKIISDKKDRDERGKLRLEFLKTLYSLEKESTDVNKAFTIMHAIIEKLDDKLNSKISLGQETLLHLLLKFYPTYVNTVNKFAPKHAANYSEDMHNHYIKLYKFMVEKNARIDIKNLNLQTPLFLAVEFCSYHCPEIVTDMICNRKARISVAEICNILKKVSFKEPGQELAKLAIEQITRYTNNDLEVCQITKLIIFNLENTVMREKYVEELSSWLEVQQNQTVSIWTNKININNLAKESSKGVP